MSHFLALILLLAISTPSLSSSSDICKLPKNQEAASLAYSKDIIREIEIQRFEDNPAKRCDEIMVDRYLLVNGLDSDGLRSFNFEQKLKLMKEKLIQNHDSGTTLAFTPDKATRENLITSNITWPDNMGYKVGSKPTLAEVESKLTDLFQRDPCSFPRRYPRMSRLQLADISKQSPRLDFTKRTLASVGSATLCRELVGFTKIPTCASSATKMIQDMEGTDSGDYIGQARLFPEVIGSGNYDEGLKHAAMKMIGRYRSGDVSKADLFSDLKASFVETGTEPKLAEEYTWNTLGLLMTGGANLKIRLEKIGSPGHRQQVITALSAIS